MHEAAKRDGVPLKVVSGYRPPPRPDKAVSKNPMAKATNSSHNYGLALDFQLSVDQLHVKETNTHDVDNLLAYYGSSVTKWLVMNAARFDFHPYSKEPWHYEYNPDGMAEEIIAGAKAASK
jgi:LAS superfamily LD-carboxypeptidase LdcB